MKRILMVDDVATNLRCATEVLKDQYEITAVKSGQQAMESLGDVLPDLVLLDINMPGMNGFEVFDRIKRIPEFSKIPVVFLTAQKDKDVEVRGREMGAADFIRKPYDPNDLRKRIEEVFLNNSKGQAAMLNRAAEDFLGAENEKKLKAWADSRTAKGFFILLNLDRFEQVKEFFGPAAEKMLLLKIEDILNVIPESGKCFCHVKDNDYATYLDGSYSIDAVKGIARRMIAELEFEMNECISEEWEMKITVSAGIAAKPEDGSTYEELLEHADKALYFVKESGKRKYYFYSMNAGGKREGTEEKETINLLQLRHQFAGREFSDSDSVESINKAYHVISKYWENTGEETQIIFFGIEGAGANTENTNLLSEVISESLRKGDVAVKCGKFQYITVLLNTSAENGEMVARRIKKKFKEKAVDNDIGLIYEMRR